MFSERDFAEAAEVVLRADERLARAYDALLEELEDEAARLRLVGLRQDLRRREARLRLLRSLLEA